MNDNDEQDQNQGQEPEQEQPQVPANNNDQGDSSVKQGVQQATQKTKEKLLKRAAKSIKSGAAKKSLMAFLGPILLWGFVILVIIIIIIGIAMFLVTMPGMVMDQLKAMFHEMGDYIAAFFGADTAKQIEKVEVYETLDYLEQMGWDLKGEGFLTDYTVKEDESTKRTTSVLEDGKKAKYDEQVGVIRDDDDKIVNAYSDYIFTYMVSDNYIYTIKNHNLTAQKNSNDSWIDKLATVVSGIATTVYKATNGILGPVYDLIGITDAEITTWGKGLLAFYYDKGLGIEGTYVNDKTYWNWDSIEVDVESKTLKIAKNSLFNNNNAMEFSLDGWTGRYGMPLEFLLSIHKATMMPDLAYDMATTFNTSVNIYLHDISGTASAAYKTESNGYIDYSKLQEATSAFKETGRWTALANWFDDLFINSSEVFAAKELGIDVATPGENGCECVAETVLLDESGDNVVEEKDGKYYYEDETEYTGKVQEITTLIQACDHCKNKLARIKDCLGANNDFSYAAYQPYIASVTEHWYRDVYFVFDSEKGKEFVDYDYDYETMTGERWTLYETYTSDPNDGDLCNPDKEGEFVYYEIDDDGEYKKNSDGSYKIYKGNVVSGEVYVITEEGTDTKRIASVGEDGTKVAKKAVTIDSTDEDTMTDLGWNKIRVQSKLQKVAATISKIFGGNGDEIENKIKEVKSQITAIANMIGATDKVKEAQAAIEKINDAVANGLGVDTNEFKQLVSDLNTKIDDAMKDMGLKEYTVWSAYTEKTSETRTEYERIYQDDDIDDDDANKDIKSNIYVSLSTTGNVVQTGEGQRTETNADIKKMFLINKYFRYDGSAQTAEIITAFKDKLEDDGKSRYGAVDDGLIYDSNGDEIEYDLDFSDDKYTSEAQTGKYKLADYVGNVTLTQDSLNAFTMLENTHTLDADYIYRDFKELIVELGYFEKEELTDETPKLLQFIVPDIGSGEYPDSDIDKRENENGTMVHSKSDIEINKLHTIVEKIRAAASEENQARDASKYPTTGHYKSTAKTKDKKTKSKEKVKGIDLTEVGEIEGATKTPEQVSVEEFLTAAEEVHKVIEELQFQYCWGVGNSHNSDMPHTDGHGCAGLFNTLEEACGDGGHRIDCSTYVSYVLQAVGLMTGRTYTGSPGGSDGLYGLFSHYVITREEAGELQPGDILISDSHTQINGENNMQYNAGSGDKIRSRPYEEAYPSFYTHVIRLPFNGNNDEGAVYEGYEGNDAVVSPVTGILLEYGTYEKVDTTNPTDSEGNRITTEDPRVNVDLKYGFPNIYENLSDDSGSTNPKADPDDEFESQTVSDRVGYAKILVLDAEHYQKLESGTKNSWQDSDDSLVKIDQKTTKLDGEQVTSNRVSFKEALTGKRVKTSDDEDYSKEYEDWTMLDKTVYGYKEFAETYEKYGIAGYVVYIDGFKCELPDPDLTSEDGEDGDIASQIPNPDTDGKRTLSMKKFQETITESDLNTTEAPEKTIESKYESDEAYKLASEKTTNKLAAEVDLKTQASSTICVDGVVYIKEGTILGRTLTDKELLESSEYRNKKYGTYEKLRENLYDDKDDNDDNLQLIGNYLRIILRDEDGTVVENVEDYMKLDDVGQKERAEVDWEFYYWLPYESGPLGESGVATHDGPGACGTVSNASEVACGIAQWTAYGSTNNIAPLCKWLAEEDPSLCGSLAAFGSYSTSQICASLSSLQQAWWAVNEKDTDGFLELQMKYFYEHEFQEWLESYGTEWLADKSLVAQGTYASLMNWGPNLGWEDVIDSSMSDEEIVKALLTKARPINSTCGTLEARWDSQYVLAKDIITGTFTEVEEWVRTKEPSNYGEGQNSGALLAYKTFDNKLVYVASLFDFVQENIDGGVYGKKY